MESGSWPLSFWITICCIILSRSSQYWTVLPLLLSKKEKNSGDTSTGFKTWTNIFQQRSPARATKPDRCLQPFPTFLEFWHTMIIYVTERHLLPPSKCVVRHIFIFKIKASYNSFHLENFTTPLKLCRDTLGCHKTKVWNPWCAPNLSHTVQKTEPFGWCPNIHKHMH